MFDQLFLLLWKLNLLKALKQFIYKERKQEGRDGGIWLRISGAVLEERWHSDLNFH